MSKKIKTMNLFLSLTYSEPGTPETYTDILHPSEIDINGYFKSNVISIEILKDPKSRKIDTETAKKIIRLLTENVV